MFKLYIGSNNETNELEIQKIKGITGAVFEGFTFYEAVGYWKGLEEKTAIIEIETEEEDKIQNLIETLKKELKQEAVAVEVLPSLKFI
jgi:hypothetical protein